jgi:hypothetical protein
MDSSNDTIAAIAGAVILSLAVATAPPERAASRREPTGRDSP